MSDNLLYYGDNLDVLRRHVKDESVDLVYLDSPFKSNQDYRGGRVAAVLCRSITDRSNDPVRVAEVPEVCPDYCEDDV